MSPIAISRAAQLAADLDALIAGYRFDPKELRQFMRQLFRKEYAKELEETEQALDAQPGLGFGIPQYHPPQRVSSASIETPTETRLPAQKAGEITAAPETDSPIMTVEQPTAKMARRSPDFWGSLFKRKK